MNITNLPSPGKRHRDRGRSHAGVLFSVQNSFKRLCDEGISSFLSALARVTRRFDHRWSTGRNLRETDQIIQDFNRSIALIADTDALITSIVARINELFGTDRVIFLHTYPDSGLFSLAFSMGYNADALRGMHLTQRDRLARWLLTNETALIVDRDQGVLGYLSNAERQMLESLDVRVCVPLLALNRLTGLMLLSSTQQGWSLTEEDLKLLLALLGQTSIAYESAYLSELQRERMRRLYRAERLATAGQLAASVAHEIRNPLTAIRSTIQYLLREFDDSSLKHELVKGVILEVDRIDRTVDGLLSLTRRTEFMPGKLSLVTLIAQALLLIRTQAQVQSIEILFDEPPQDVYVMADEAQIKQVVINLMMNAIQAMPDGGRLQVDFAAEYRSVESPGEKDCTVISIADTGCGIPTENLDKIFDPFFTTKPGGTGLGLSTCYAIVQQHGGDLQINSRENIGTKVSMRLPLLE
jgi:two-component system, NtrC family, sensor kinase